MATSTVQPGSVVDTLAFSRALRRQGEADTAAEVLDTALAEPLLQVPVTAELAVQAGWLHLERADLHTDAGQLTQADQQARVALDDFEAGGEGAGAAAACLALGDLAWQAGATPAAASWWARGRSLADAVGATPLAARSLLALALHDMAGGDADVADARLDAAADRAAHGLDEALAPEDPEGLQQARDQIEAVKAGIALVRARRALAQRRWSEARLLLSATVESARRLHEPSLYVDALRLDAVLARRLGDPQAAVESLQLALDAAGSLQAVRLRALVQSELVLALCDADRLADAAALHNQTPPVLVATQPAVHALRLEAFAVLALRSGRRDVAGQALAEAMTLRRDLGDAVGEARAGLLQAEVELARGRPEAAETLADRAQGLASAAGRADLALDAALFGVRVAVQQQETAAAQRASDLAGQATHVGSVAQQLVALDLLAAALLQDGQGTQALEAAQRALDLANGQPLQRLQARAQGRLALVLLQTGDAQGAVQAAGRAAQTSDAAQDPLGRVRALLVGGRALGHLGRSDEAVLALGHAVTAAAAAHRQDLGAEAAFDLGNVHVARHGWQAGQKAFETAQQLAAQAGLLAVAVRALRGQALCQRHLGEFANAQALLDTARHLAREGALLTEYVAVVVDAAQVGVDQGDLPGARQVLQALDLPHRDDVPAGPRGDGLTLLGRVLAQQGDPAGAAEVLRQAVQVLRPAGIPRSLGAALLLLGQMEGLLGHGEACGHLLGEALVVTAQHGLPEQAMVRQVIERLQKQQV